MSFWHIIYAFMQASFFSNFLSCLPAYLHEKEMTIKIDLNPSNMLLFSFIYLQQLPLNLFTDTMPEENA